MSVAVSAGMKPISNRELDSVIGGNDQPAAQAPNSGGLIRPAGTNEAREVACRPIQPGAWVCQETGNVGQFPK